jgi:hypothetical protein
MISRITPAILIAFIFLWIGFVGAISFMEAWIKFRAPGITLPLGLGVGRLVFNALNKMEWVCAILIVLSGILSQRSCKFSFGDIFIIIPVLILIVQSGYLLPELDARAEMHISGGDVKPSNIHFVYVASEFVKVCSLIIYSISSLKQYICKQ